MFIGQFVFSQLAEFLPKYEFDKCVALLIAICTYLLVAIVKRELKIERSLYEILQILSISALDKTPLFQLLTEFELENDEYSSTKQLTLFDL
jgi:hypothetical protein